MTLALSTTAWAALALVLPPDLRARIVAALRSYGINDRQPVPIQLSVPEAELVATRLRRMA